MKPLSPQEELKIIDALTAPENGWMSSWQESYDLIRKHHACSAETADRIFEDLYAKRKLIAFVSEHSATPYAHNNPFSYKWKRP